MHKAAGLHPISKRWSPTSRGGGEDFLQLPWSVTYPVGDVYQALNTYGVGDGEMNTGENKKEDQLGRPISRDGVALAQIRVRLTQWKANIACATGAVFYTSGITQSVC